MDSKITYNIQNSTESKREFDFENATDEQSEAITHTEGPLLITAGPGTGKTFTLIKRVTYLIVVKNIKPENIMLTTFTRKAAKELRSRLILELKKYETPTKKYNISKMYLGTIHSLCERILREFVSYSSLGKNPTKESLRHISYLKNHRLLDDIETKMFVSTKLLPVIYKQNKEPNKPLYNYNNILNSFWKDNHEVWKGSYNRFFEINNIVQTVNNLISSNVDIDKLIKYEQDPVKNMMGQLTRLYIDMMKENYLLDQTMLISETYKLLTCNKVIRNAIQNKIQYLMIDEYQDTDKIQEQIIFQIGNKHKNICVVGDDDQSLYRWRGATVDNILSFKDKLPNCEEIKLEENFRSTKQIVDFGQEWIGLYNWDLARLPKHIHACDKAASDSVNYDSVATLTRKDNNEIADIKGLSEGVCVGNEEDWLGNCSDFIKQLLDSGFVDDYSDIVFLFRSVKNTWVIQLATYFEKIGIPVYSPRSALFFERKEVKLILGLLLHIFDWYFNDDTQMSYLSEQLSSFYKGCYRFCSGYLNLDKANPNKIQKWINDSADFWSDNNKIHEFALTKIIYEALQFAPIAKLIEVDLKTSIYKQRTARNIAILIDLISKFDDLFHKSNIDNTIIEFFNNYMKILYENNLNEYESEKESIPKGCISFLTFHQSKGMEFPVTVVGSLNQFPKMYYPTKLDEIKLKYSTFPSSNKEDISKINYYDYFRDFYVAFTRAKNLLVLLPGLGKKGRNSQHYKITYNEDYYDLFSAYPSIANCEFDNYKCDSNETKSILESYTYTKHIELYKKCPLRYKFYRELNFVEPSTINTFFGTLVHQTIEDINVAAIHYSQNPNFVEAINRSIDSWFELNYESLSKCHNLMLSKDNKVEALKQVKDYIKFIGNRWSEIYDAEAEVDYYFDEGQFIIKGATDLIRKKPNGNYEVIDFKTGKKPKTEKQDYQVQLYQKQIELYAYLLKVAEGKNVDAVKLFYTGERQNPEIVYDISDFNTKNFSNEINSIVTNIQKQNFNENAKDKTACKWCPFISYCNIEYPKNTYNNF